MPAGGVPPAALPPAGCGTECEPGANAPRGTIPGASAGCGGGASSILLPIIGAPAGREGRKLLARSTLRLRRRERKEHAGSAVSVGAPGEPALESPLRRQGERRRKLFEGAIARGRLRHATHRTGSCGIWPMTPPMASMWLMIARMLSLNCTSSCVFSWTWKSVRVWGWGGGRGARRDVRERRQRRRPPASDELCRRTAAARPLPSLAP